MGQNVSRGRIWHFSVILHIIIWTSVTQWYREKTGQVLHLDSKKVVNPLEMLYTTA